MMAVNGGRLRVAYVGYPDDQEEWPIAADAPQRRKAARPRLQQPSYCFRRLRAQPFWKPTEAGSEIAALCASLEGAFDAIVREVLPLLAPLLDDDASGSDDGDHDATASGSRWTPQGENLHEGVWLRAEIWSRGVRDAKLCEQLPSLARILDSSAALMKDPPGRTYLSLMMGGTEVAAHCGPTNHRLRVHLPLLLPPPPRAGDRLLGICVGGERRAWQLGNCLVLDDSFEHSLSLPSELSSPRVLLVADCWHPDAGWLVPREERK